MESTTPVRLLFIAQIVSFVEHSIPAQLLFMDGDPAYLSAGLWNAQTIARVELISLA
jgi:hypothetical protein